MGKALPDVEKIRAIYGDDCWFCGHALDFKAKPGNRKYPTREHLVAQSQGGKSDLINLRLCHFGCNQQLNDRPLIEKLKIRDRKRHADRIAADRKRPAAFPVAKVRIATTIDRRWRIIFVLAVSNALMAGLLIGMVI